MYPSLLTPYPYVPIYILVSLNFLLSLFKISKFHNCSNFNASIFWSWYHVINHHWNANIDLRDTPVTWNSLYTPPPPPWFYCIWIKYSNPILILNFLTINEPLFIVYNINNPILILLKNTSIVYCYNPLWCFSNTFTSW